MDIIDEHRRRELRESWNTAAAAHQAGHLTEPEQHEQQDLALATWQASRG